MINQITYSKRFGTAVVISRPFQEDIVIQKRLLPAIIATVKNNKGDYLTQEAFDAHLAMYENALKFMESMDKPYKVEYGCDEWQDEREFDTLQEAHAFVENSSNLIIGLHPAQYCWIEENGVVTETILNEDEELDF